MLSVWNWACVSHTSERNLKIKLRKRISDRLFVDKNFKCYSRIVIYFVFWNWWLTILSPFDLPLVNIAFTLLMSTLMTVFMVLNGTSLYVRWHIYGWLERWPCMRKAGYSIINQPNRNKLKSFNQEVTVLVTHTWRNMWISRKLNDNFKIFAVSQ